MTTGIYTNSWISQSAKILYRGNPVPDPTKFYVALANTATLTRASGLTDFISAELLPANGYARANITFSSDGSFNVTNLRHEMPVIAAGFVASGASFQFQTAFLLAGASAIASQSFTNSNVNPTTDRIIINAHGYANGDQLCFTADPTGTLPTGIAASTLYTVANVTTNDFQLQLSGTTLNITDTGSGTFRARSANGNVVILATESSPITVPSGQGYTYQIPIVLSNTGYVNGV